MKSIHPHPHHLGLRWVAILIMSLAPLHLHASSTAPDLDGDGIPNLVDPDIDADGIPNALDDNVDGGIAKTGPYAGMHIGDNLNNDNPAEKDLDSDSLADDSLGEIDIDGDGMTDSDPLELDIDADRRPDDSPTELDIDGDGRLDDFSNEDDIDGDGLDDDDIMEFDIDGDHLSDSNDSDIDGDNRSNIVIDENDTDGDGRLNGDADEDDSDGDGIKNRDDGDDDNDQVDDEDDSDHHDELDEVKVEQKLSRTAAAPSQSEVQVNFQKMATGTLKLTIEADKLNPGTYNILIGGNQISTLVVTGSPGNASGERKFKTNGTGDYLPLNFDPTAQSISLELNGIPYFTGTVPTPPELPPVDPPEPPVTQSKQQLLTPSAGLSSGARAKVVVDFGLVGVIEVEVEVESIPQGEYTISIGGIIRGTLLVTENQSTLTGNRHFEVIPDEIGELLLDFAVVGQSIEISQSNICYFKGTIPEA